MELLFVFVVINISNLFKSYKYYINNNEQYLEKISVYNINLYYLLFFVNYFIQYYTKFACKKIIYENIIIISFKYIFNLYNLYIF